MCASPNVEYFVSSLDFASHKCLAAVSNVLLFALGAGKAEVTITDEVTIDILEPVKL